MVTEEEGFEAVKRLEEVIQCLVLTVRCEGLEADACLPEMIPEGRKSLAEIERSVENGESLNRMKIECTGPVGELETIGGPCYLELVQFHGLRGVSHDEVTDKRIQTILEACTNITIPGFLLLGITRVGKFGQKTLHSSQSEDLELAPEVKHQVCCVVCSFICHNVIHAEGSEIVGIQKPGVESGV